MSGVTVETKSKTSIELQWQVDFLNSFTAVSFSPQDHPEINVHAMNEGLPQRYKEVFEGLSPGTSYEIRLIPKSGLTVGDFQEVYVELEPVKPSIEILYSSSDAVSGRIHVDGRCQSYSVFIEPGSQESTGGCAEYISFNFYDLFGGTTYVVHAEVRSGSHKESDNVQVITKPGKVSRIAQSVLVTHVGKHVQMQIHVEETNGDFLFIQVFNTDEQVVFRQEYDIVGCLYPVEVYIADQNLFGLPFTAQIVAGSEVGHIFHSAIGVAVLSHVEFTISDAATTTISAHFSTVGPSDFVLLRIDPDENPNDAPRSCAP